jgi:RND family efflux transporter MFP subunit
MRDILLLGRVSRPCLQNVSPERVSRTVSSEPRPTRMTLGQRSEYRKAMTFISQHRSVLVRPRLARAVHHLGVASVALSMCAAAMLAACREQGGAAAAATPPSSGGGNPAAPSVTVVVATPETLAVSSEWIASLDGYVNAQIRPQVSGYLIEKTYDEGSKVKKDQVLFRIDARPFRTALAQAQASLAKAQADLGRAERDKARDAPLAKERAIPQSQLDNDVQSALAAQAAVKAAEASIEAAQLNVSFTQVKSLVDGVAAIATAQIGDLVTPSSLLTTVSQLDPIKAYFSLSEQEYLRAAKQLNQASKQQPWQAGAALRLFLADGSEYDKTGSFLAADRQIDTRTGTIRISATFPNPDNLLRPGLYGRVRADTATLKDALLVPQRAVAEMQGAAQLRVVGPDNKVSLRNVVLGSRSGNRWVIESGIAPGDQVILDGPQLRDGTVVTPNPVSAATAANVPAPSAPTPGAPAPAGAAPGGNPAGGAGAPTATTAVAPAAPRAAPAPSGGAATPDRASATPPAARAPVRGE